MAPTKRKRFVVGAAAVIFSFFGEKEGKEDERKEAVDKAMDNVERKTWGIPLSSEGAEDGGQTLLQKLSWNGGGII